MIILEERLKSGELTAGANPGYTRDYWAEVTAGEDEFAVRDHVLATVPNLVDGMVRNSVAVRRLDGKDIKRWEVRVAWGAVKASFSGPQQTGTVRASFSTQGSVTRVYKSLQTISKTAASGTAPDFKGAINVTREGVEGADVVSPSLRRTYTKVFEDSEVNQAYEDTLFALTGKVNTAAFKGYPAKSVLFLGAQGGQRADGKWEFGFQFEVRPNRTMLDIGGGIVVPAVNGHELLWVYFREEIDATANATVKVPKAAYVEKMYEDGNFAALNV